MKRMLWLGPVVAVALLGLLSSHGRTGPGAVGAATSAARVEVLGTMSCEKDIPDELQTARVFRLCDGETKVLVRVADASLDGPLPRETAAAVAKVLWDQWQVMKEEKLAAARKEGIVVAHGGTPHGRRELATFESELKNMIDMGYALFHSSELGTNGISCDMCHPDASNTHPETYPKFQTQLKKAVLLRDMINWCIENPQEGKPLPENDPRMKAIEAYILSARQGFDVEVGKH